MIMFDIVCRINNLINNFDDNKDGKITREEYFSGVERHFIGKTPETVPRMIHFYSTSIP